MTTDDRPKAFSRRKFIQAAAAASGTAFGPPALALNPRSRGHSVQQAEPDLVLQGGRIHTMDGTNRIVSSVAIKNGRFVEVGNAGRYGRGRATKIIDLDGRTVVPGIIDNHNHLVLMGNRPGYHTPLENAQSIPDVQAIYAARAARIPGGAWITTIGGFHSNHIYATPGDPLSGRLPTLAELDAATPNNPVFASIGFSGPSATNTAGKAILEAQGVTVSTTGAIAGGTQTTRALLYLRKTLLDAESRRRGVIDAMRYAASVGVTSHLDQGAFQKTDTETDGAAHEDNFSMHVPFLEVYDQGKGIVRLRINFLHMEADPNTPELRERLKNAFPFLGDDLVRTGGIGEFIAQGTNPSTSPQFLAAARRVAAARWRAEVHSLGRRQTPASPPADFEFEISAFETVNAEFPGVVRDRRWVIAHVPGITQEWIDRLQAIGGNLSLTGWQYLAGNLPTSTVAPYAGPPFRTIVDSSKRPDGIHVGMSSDGMQIAPMNPWIHMYFATTGLNARKVLINPGQQISRQEVLSLYTRENGWFLREEDQLGSIEEGKLADMVVLNRDYFSVPAEDLKQIRSVLTVVDGEVVHDTKELHFDRDHDDDRGKDRRDR
jgi:predicted amidohydrolase YtcJ